MNIPSEVSDILYRRNRMRSAYAVWIRAIRTPNKLLIVEGPTSVHLKAGLVKSLLFESIISMSVSAASTTPGSLLVKAKSIPSIARRKSGESGIPWLGSFVTYASDVSAGKKIFHCLDSASLRVTRASTRISGFSPPMIYFTHSSTVGMTIDSAELWAISESSDCSSSKNAARTGSKFSPGEPSDIILNTFSIICLGRSPTNLRPNDNPLDNILKIMPIASPFVPSRSRPTSSHEAFTISSHPDHSACLVFPYSSSAFSKIICRLCTPRLTMIVSLSLSGSTPG
mmetsp:Transcript_21992/g.89323  ORF Transcript_21992/g.89323 Transcript_21992/m.89323 type:complete len:284 (-) Transcript_21992:2303-3154(-)